MERRILINYCGNIPTARKLLSTCDDSDLTGILLDATGKMKNFGAVDFTGIIEGRTELRYDESHNILHITDRPFKAPGWLELGFCRGARYIPLEEAYQIFSELFAYERDIKSIRSLQGERGMFKDKLTLLYPNVEKLSFKGLDGLALRELEISQRPVLNHRLIKGPITVELQKGGSQFLRDYREIRIADKSKGHYGQRVVQAVESAVPQLKEPIEILYFDETLKGVGWQVFSTRPEEAKGWKMHVGDGACISFNPEELYERPK